MPQFLSKNSKALLRALFKRNPKNRLGSGSVKTIATILLFSKKVPMVPKTLSDMSFTRASTGMHCTEKK